MSFQLFQGLPATTLKDSLAEASSVRASFPSSVFTTFPSLGLSDYQLPAPRTLVELCMVKLSASIRAKPDWWSKYTDPDIRSRWRSEALSTRMVWIERATMLVPYEDAQEVFTGGPFNEYSLEESIVQLSEEQVDYVLDELDGYAKLRDEQTGIQVSSFDGVWHSDSLIGDDLCERLNKGVAVLEDVPASEKDWHPGSNEQVLDLVHPSLYCVVYNRTLAYPRTSDTSARTTIQPRPVPVPKFTRIGVVNPKLLSVNFQWLPTDFAVASDGTVKSLGYINNLHPSHVELYETIERILSAFIPLFERVLTDMRYPLPLRIPGNYLPLEDVDPQYPQRKDDDISNFWERHGEYFTEVWEKSKVVGLPKLPEGGYSGGLEKRENLISLRGRTVQVIVKLANIHLTPEKPEYKGGSWHIEGMANERIVASGLYYYDQENITESELAFRIAVDEPEIATKIQADPYDYYAHYKTWGMVMAYIDSTMLTNVVGATATTQGRCLAFPNTYQHRVSPFRLADPSKPGHRKLLAFFLVNPNIEKLIPSTSIVPPQQRAWVERALREVHPNSLVHRLPVELLDAILKQTSPEIMSEEDARKIRLELMKERTSKEVDQYNPEHDLFSRVFDLCEH